MNKYVYILNFGDYFARLAASKIRSLGGRPRVVSFNTPYAELKHPAGFILSGSPHGSIRVPVKILNEELFATNFPIMGICLGAQLIARYFGGKYKNLRRRAENGIVDMHLDKRGKLFKGLKKTEKVFMMHEDSLVDPGEGFEVAAHTARCPIAAAWHREWRWYAFQFHPELSPCGDTIFANFLRLCYRDHPEFSPKKKDLEDFGIDKKVVRQSMPEYK